MLINHTKIYQVAQIKELEALASIRFALSGYELMQRAGAAALDFLRKRWPHAKRLIVFCGPGNNGGDGYALAEQAHKQNLEVEVWQVDLKGSHPKTEMSLALEACISAGIKINKFLGSKQALEGDVIVDAIYGIGFRGVIDHEAGVAVDAINQSNLPVLALDIPSGVDADVGAVLGPAIKATATLTFLGLKLGLLAGQGVAQVGELYCDNLELLEELYTLQSCIAERLQLEQFADHLKPRPRDFHKGNAGHVLVAGGGEGYSGAPRMAAEAALRVGAGLVTIATHPSHAEFLNLARPEIMCVGVKSRRDLDVLLKKAQIVIVGPGLGQSRWAQKLFLTVLDTQLPLVVDADALNLLALKPKARANWVLTPHPGEAARLLNLTTEQVQADRLAAILQLEQKYIGICVLKGAGTLVATSTHVPALCNYGNPGMATAGMGDVLSGVIGGLAAQGIPLAIAAKLGVCLHAQAGDLAAKEGERGMIAMDLMPHLRHLVNPN